MSGKGADILAYILPNLGFLNFIEPNLPGLFEGHRQSAVNGAAKNILNASLEIKRWGQTDLNGDEENRPGVDYDSIGTGSFYDEIASDIEIVKLVLLLTGSIEGVKKKVVRPLEARRYSGPSASGCSRISSIRLR